MKMPNEPTSTRCAHDLPEDLTAKDFGDMAEVVEALRLRFVFDFEDAAVTPMAEQYFLLAMAALETAKCQLKLADYNQMQKR